MSRLITDEMVETFAIVGSPEEAVKKMTHRFGGLINRTGLAIPGLSDEQNRDLIDQLRSGEA